MKTEKVSAASSMSYAMACAGGNPHDIKINRIRHKIENSFGRLKDWRRVAPRYDRRPIRFLSAAALAARILFWL